MKPIKAYITIDGTIFKNEKDAINYEKNYNLKAKIYEFCKSAFGFDLDDSIASTLFNNKDELLEILKGEY